MARVLVLVIVLGVARVAAAEPVRWSAPEECGAVAVVHARITEHLGRPVDVGELSADVEIVRDEAGEGFRAAMRIETAVGVAEREVRAAECAAVVDAVALVLALAVQEAADPAPAAPPRPAPTPVAAPVIEAPAPAATRWSPEVRLRAGGEVAAGVVPGAGLGVVAGVEIGGARIGAEVGVVAYAPANAEVDGVALADIDVVAGRARGCGRREALRICGGGELGRMRGVGMRSGSRRWSAVTLGVAWAQPLTRRLAAVVAVEGGVTVDRPRFVLDDGTEVYRPSALLGRLGLGLEIDW